VRTSCDRNQRRADLLADKAAGRRTGLTVEKVDDGGIGERSVYAHNFDARFIRERTA
jgi:hypothetical protein